MKKIAKFEKVSFEQFYKDFRKCESSVDGFKKLVKTEDGDFYRSYSDEEVREIYDNIKLPKRATRGSAGYDFFCPIDITLCSGGTVFLPTGIRCYIEEGWVLKLYPRSGFGFKYRLQLDNTVGIIDSDYYFSDNEGHMMAKITYDKKGSSFSISQGQGYMQGIFIEYGITCDDDTDGIRNGGFGSTDTK